ncbi:unnamed protein product, partial [Rotaria socialis]
PTFWTFDIWDSAASSTTATTTTRPQSTTPVNTLCVSADNNWCTFINTGSLANTTTIPVNNSDSPIQIMSPQDFETACASPVAIINAVNMLIMFPMHGLLMYVFYLKFSAAFNPLMQQA